MAGGLYDQPAGLMRKVRMVLNTYNAFKLYESEGKKAGEMAQWRSENEEVWYIVHELDELRELYE